MWRPALTWQAFCSSDTGVIRQQATQIPALIGLLADPRTRVLARPGRPGRRVPPGPRVNAAVAADALQREAAALLGGWAARVRAVPGLGITEPGSMPGTAERLAADCRDLALYTVPLLALQPGWTTRTYSLPAGRDGGVVRSRGTCRLCGRAVTRSPVSGWWWALDGAAAFCDHDPGRIPGAVTPGPVPDDLAAQIGDDEITVCGDGWVRVMTRRDGRSAGLEILELHYRGRRLAGCVPAPRVRLDGVPCRRQDCDQMALELAEPPSDPSLPAMHSRCAACRDEMTREEYDEWAARYARWAQSAGTFPCSRCRLGRCGECRWDACQCRAGGHAGHAGEAA